MKVILSILLAAIGFIAQAQPLAGSNLRNWYDPDMAGQFNVKIVRAPDSIFAYYEVDTITFKLEWEKRDSYGQRAGSAVDGRFSGSAINGKIGFPVPEKP